MREARNAFDREIEHGATRAVFSDRLDQVPFVGVSQGAIVALAAVASGRWRIGPVVAFSGTLIVWIVLAAVLLILQKKFALDEPESN
jgi:phospholipase/carboxylesterase